MWLTTHGCSGDSIPLEKSFLKVLLLAPRVVRTRESGFCLCLPSFSAVARRSCSSQTERISCPVECKRYKRPRIWSSCERKHNLRRELLGNFTTTAHVQTEELDTHALQIKHIVTQFSVLAARSKYKVQAKSLRQKREDRIGEIFSDRGTELRSVLATFRREIPKYQSNCFRGRGIVMVGGRSRKYHMSYWLAVLSARRSGCSLPIYIWFPADEVPSHEEKLSLKELQVTIVTFEEHGIVLKASNRFSMKILAITFSKLQEVLFLDSDQVVLRDPTLVFYSDAYKRLGLTMWKDFWKPSYAPDIERVVKRPVNTDWTHESGQMVVNKALVWDALLLACHFNIHYRIFYPLTNGYLGWGDKETIPLAMNLLDRQIDVVDFLPDHVGIETPSGLFGNSMLQFWKDSLPIFLHANLGKYTGALPVAQSQWIRRWRSSLKYGTQVQHLLEHTTGIDLELWVHNVTTVLHCETWYQNIEKLRWYENINVGPLLEGMFIAEKSNELSPYMLELVTRFANTT